MELYKAQQGGVDRFLTLAKPRRLILGWPTGCGKGGAALTALKESGARNTLIICPAAVREHWYREAERWAPDVRLSILRPSKKWKELSDRGGPKLLIVSYDMLGRVPPQGYDLIIIDELHHIAWPCSQQSERIRKLVRLANPNADVLGLTATPSPTEIKQLWHPLYVLFGPERWGSLSPTGERINWNFKNTYCEVERNEHGYWQATGAKESMRDELKRRLLPCIHYLTREDIAADLPPLHLSVVEYELESGRSRGIPTTDVINTTANRIVKWILEQPADKVVVFLHLREHAKAAYMLARQGTVELCQHEIYYIDGSLSVERRMSILDQCAAGDKVVLVATHDSLREGVRLMWAQEVFLGQWPMSPGALQQILGRFNSVDHPTSRPHVNLICSAAEYGRAAELVYRIQALQDVLCKNESLEELQRMAEQMRDGASDDPASLGEEWLQMLSGVREGGHIMGEDASL